MTSTADPDPKDVNEYVLYELLSTIGWTGNRQAFAERVARRYERKLHTLAAEDEFSLLLGWLGRCQLVHKLDQVQAPPESKNHYQVPDLQAVFNYRGRTIPVLIEVKTKKLKPHKGFSEPLIDWKGSYLEKLQRYGCLLRQPVLVAVRVDPLDLWTLFDVRLLRLARTNYKIGFTDAMKHNLLGWLAGDFAIGYEAGAGFHVKFRKIGPAQRIEREPDIVTQEMVIEDAYITRANGQRVASGRMGPIMFIAPFEDYTEEDGDALTQHFEIPPEGQMQFGHQAFAVDMRNRRGDDFGYVRWAEELRRFELPLSRDRLLRQAEQEMKHGLVRHVFRLQPTTVPDFLSDAESSPNGVSAVQSGTTPA